MDGIIVFSAKRLAKDPKLVAFLRDEKERGQKNRLLVMNAMSRYIVAHDLDAENDTIILAPDQPHDAIAYIVRTTGLKVRCVQQHLASAISRKVFIRSYHGNRDGKRGRGFATYAFGPNGKEIERLFKCKHQSANALSQSTALNAFGAKTLEACEQLEPDEKGRNLYRAPDGSVFYLRQVRRKVCCSGHRAACRGHRSRFRTVLIPHLVKHAERDLGPLSAKGREIEEWPECEVCGEIIKPGSPHPRVHTSETNANRARAESVQQAFIRTRVVGRVSYGPRRFWQVLIKGRKATDFERAWLSPAQMLTRDAMSYGFSPYQRADLFKLAKKVGYEALLRGGYRNSLLAYLGDECGAVTSSKDEYGDVSYAPFIENRRMTRPYSRLKRLLSDRYELDALMARHDAYLASQA